ncbi:protein NYNRIN-like [Grus japonensis]|uniref:Protein NYNRIN-like n=1 Tax=Grus japonensis TaxID=30415 RepID=A0ABC9YIV1_GRUJA
MLKYQVVLLEQDDVELKATAIVNPAMFLTTENPTEKLEHDCLVTIEQVYSSRPDLKDEPLKDPDLELFTDGSSFVQEGRRIAGYAVVTTDKVLESGTLPANTSAQKAELVALKQALRMAEGKRELLTPDYSIPETTDAMLILGEFYTIGMQPQEPWGAAGMALPPSQAAACEKRGKKRGQSALPKPDSKRRALAGSTRVAGGEVEPEQG